MNAKGMTVVSASAGSGKTYRLTEEVSNAIDPSGSDALPLESLVAVTYTKKAHAELAARIRHRLVGGGAFDEALRLPLAYVGTVHAMCLRLLQEFAIDAGLSPNVDVVSEDAGKLLRQALEASLSKEAHATLDRLADRVKLRHDPIVKRQDWVGPVADIMDLARSNRIRAEDLPQMAARSVDGIMRLLPAPERDGDALDFELARALGSARLLLIESKDDTKATKKVIDSIESAVRRLKRDELDWPSWAELSKLEPSARSKGLVADLQEVASRHLRHPRLHAEIRELTFAIFDAARIGLSSYRTWKERRRVVDYVDMLDRALDLVSAPRVDRELRERLKLVVVDEFQDTSPIQLALFTKLHELSNRSVWVGDRKQCIFEYAGADPQLMDSVASWVEASGGKRDVLRHNYRSRPELVVACSELFAAALGRHTFSRDEVVVAPARTTPPALEALPPFGVWAIEAKNALANAAALADGVLRMLTVRKATPVVDRTMKLVRDVRPGDIAVLVATNAEASALADALHERGIRVAIARAGLLEKPEGVLLDAALRWLVDGADTLAAARIDALLGFGGSDPDTWLADLLAQAQVGLADRSSGQAPAPVTGWRASLEPLRQRLFVLSPSEAVDQVLAALDVVHLCARWPDPAQRVANLDALRGIAADYEGRCDQEREAGTVAGLLRYCDDVGTVKLNRDEKIASDNQHVPTDDGAVVVCTYHKSKGLEWPVVVLSSLDREERRRAFDNVCPESDNVGFDPNDPLAGRWIRYWPWPLGRQRAVPLTEIAETSPEGLAVAKREEKERARLLYVGFTRARDHLVLAVRAKVVKAKTKKDMDTSVTESDWLDGLADGEGTPLVGLPIAAKDGAEDVVRIRVDGDVRASVEVRARVWRLGGASAADVADVDATGRDVAGVADVDATGRDDRRWFVRPAPSCAETVPLRYRIVPSNAAVDWPELAVPALGEIVELPAAIALDAKVTEYDVLGDAVHAFFAADVEGLTAEERADRAQRLIASAGLAGVLRGELLVAASDRLRAFVHGRWPAAVWHREVPVDALVESAQGQRRVGGIIDLLLETAEGYVIVDHKTFPAKSHAAWRAKAVEFLPQFAAYAEALRRLGGRDVLAGWVHLPLGGAMLEVRT